MDDVDIMKIRLQNHKNVMSHDYLNKKINNFINKRPTGQNGVISIYITL